MDVECVFFKRRAGHYFPIPVEYALASLSLSLRFFSRSKNEIFAGRSGRKSWESSKRDARDNQLGVRGGNALEKSFQRIYPAVN